MGLMGRASLAPDAGLWLPDSNGIHMMFMRFPIDAVFVSRPAADGSRTVLAATRGLVEQQVDARLGHRLAVDGGHVLSQRSERSERDQRDASQSRNAERFDHG